MLFRSGVAILTTVVARRAQFHQYRLVEHLNPFDPKYQMGMYKAAGVLTAKTGVATNTAVNGLIYQEMLKQSNLFSFTDAFYLSTVIMLCVIPLVLLLKRPDHSGVPVMAH